MLRRELGRLIFCMAIFWSAPLYAYIGPGAGAGTLAVVVGILMAILMAFFAVLWYPIKRVIKKYKADKTDKTDKADKATVDGSPDPEDA